MKIMCLVTLSMAALLSGCGQPVPTEKAAYVGEWRAPEMQLLLTQDGSVAYKRLKKGVTTSVSAPLKGFNGDDFEAGVGPMSTVFDVSKPPYQEGDRWKMVVDGVVLTRMNRADSGGEW